MKVVLWGDRAVEFDAEAVRVMGAKEPVIAILVGLLPKMSRGRCYNGFSPMSVGLMPLLLHSFRY